MLAAWQAPDESHKNTLANMTCDQSLLRAGVLGFRFALTCRCQQDMAATPDEMP